MVAQMPAVKGNDLSDASATEKLIKKAQDYYNDSDYANSLKALEDALKFCPGNARMHLEAALMNQAAGDYSRARTEMITAYRAYPKLGLIFYLSGHARLQVRDFYGTITDMSMAIYIQPSETLAYVPRGLARYELGDFQGAILDFTVHIDSRQRYNTEAMAVAYLYRGRAFFEANEGDAAIVDLTESINLSPKSTEAYFLRSLQYKRNGDIAAAIRDCDAALAAKPGTAYMLRVRTWLHHELKNSISAHRDVHLLIENSGAKNSGPWFDRGSLNDSEDKIEAAIEDYKKAIVMAEAKSQRSVWIYANFCLDLLKRRTGRGTSIDYLKDVFEWPDDWPKRVGIYLAGHTSAESLERDARNTTNIFTRNQQECEAYYYIGMINLINGSKSVAQDYFNKSVDTKQVKLVEYNLAREQLHRLHP